MQYEPRTMTRIRSLMSKGRAHHSATVRRSASHGGRIIGLASALMLPSLASMTRATLSTRSPLPFAPGERITYRIRANGVGAIGHATMSVEGPIEMRGTVTYLLRSQSSAGFGPLRGSGLSESWLDPVHMRSLQFHERERRLLSTRRVNVEIDPDRKQWTDANGMSGQSPTDSSLDELSFIYFLRSLPATVDTTYSFDRHFDSARNPVTVRTMRGDTIATAAGVFTTMVMEMHVHDPRRYRGEGVIRVYLSDDACRIPVRIASAVPDVGSFVLTLESYERGTSNCR